MSIDIPNLMESRRLPLCCPECKAPLVEVGEYNECQVCHHRWPIIGGIPSFVAQDVGELGFYEAWHQEQSMLRRDGKFRHLARRTLKPLRYFMAKRERLFRRVFAGRERGPVLDLACGIGQPLYCEFGPVVGVDLSMQALRICRSRNLYERVVHGDAEHLSFLPDAYFKYAVSADFFGHVPNQAKDRVIAELHRVLAPGAVMAHVIETDSTNFMFRFAHVYAELFQKYFVEQIGGHYGLEMPSAAVKRFQNQGFRIVWVEKMWGPIWDTRQYVAQFNNGYITHSRLLRGWVAACRLLSSNPATMMMADALLGVLSNVWDRFRPLDEAQGIFLVVQKIQ